MNHEAIAERNYKIFLQSGKTALDDDLPCDKDAVYRQFVNLGIHVADYEIDIAAFGIYLRRFIYPESYRCDNGRCFTEKALEHYLSYQCTRMDSKSVVLDVANANSPFPFIIHHATGCRVYSNDLCFPAGQRQLNDWHVMVGGNACHLPLADSSIDLMTMHCALEMFEGNDDMDIVREAARVLVPGGKLVILPLYMNQRHHILRDIRTDRDKLPEIDNGAELIYMNNFENVAFARFYNPEALRERLLQVRPDVLRFSCYRVTNATSISADCYLSWIGVFEKTGTARAT
jgi:SAM-dependent methyltransferase